MRAAAAIAELCVRRWKWLPLGALLLGLFALYPTFNIEGPGTLAIALSSFTWMALLACFVPAVIAPTEAGARPDFLSAAPVPWWSVWTGRASAYVLVGSATVAAVALPVKLGLDVLPLVLAEPRWETFFAPFTIMGGIATAGYAAYRARRPVATAALGVLVLSAVGTLYLSAHAAPYGPAMFWLSVLATVPLPVFSVVYLAVGRGEPVRAAVAAAAAATVAHVPAAASALVLAIGRWPA